MRFVNLSIIFLLSFLVLSCQNLKKTGFEKKPMPEWVKAKPQSAFYYTGISSAPKKGFLPSDYIANAQQKALGDLASSISVNIASTSVLSIIETNYNLSQNFNQEIIATTSQQLEGYELVDTWEDDNFYWVYYRLSKEKFKEITAERKSQTILDAKNKYYQAKEFLNRQMHYNAFQFYVEALTVLKPYLGESNLTDIDGEEKDIALEIFNSMVEFLTSIRIEGKSEIIVKKAIDIDPEEFTFIIIDSNKNPISRIPVRINFSGSGLIRNSEVSNNEGKVVCSIKKIKSSPNQENLEIVVDVNSFSRVAKDPMIRSIIRGIPAISKSVKVIVEKPVIYVLSEEKSFGEIRSNSLIKQTFESLFGTEFFVNAKSPADFILKIFTNTIENGIYYGEKQVIISFTFELMDSKENIIYRKTGSAEYTASDYKAADNKAYIELTKSVERTIFRDILNSINK